MAAPTGDHRASELAVKAIRSIKSGNVEEASRALREAVNVAPENTHVKEAFQIVQQYDAGASPALLRLCEQFATERDVAAGAEALRYVTHGSASSLTPELAGRCFDVVVAVPAKNDDARLLRDELVAGLLQQSRAARTHLASKLRTRITPVFQELFGIGDGAANGITIVCLDRSIWPSEANRHETTKDVFLLFLATFFESDCEYDGRALKGISRHLAVDAALLYQHVDDVAFEALMYCLDYRRPREIKSQATLAVAKYLEAAGAEGEKQLTLFIRDRTAKHSTEDLVKAFSVAAATFPIVPHVVSALLLTEGFLASLVPMLDKRSRPVRVEKAALDMLSAACVDTQCRAAIAKYCSEWIHHVMDDEEDERHGQAAVILAKVQGESTNGAIAKNAPSPQLAPKSDSGFMSGDESSDSGASRRSSTKSIDEVLPTLKQMLLNGDEINRRTAVEGLAFASTRPAAKDQIIRDPELLNNFLIPPEKDAVTPAAAFGALALLDNLTRYLPPMSEEQQRMAELRAYANAPKAAMNGSAVKSLPQDAAKPDPRDEDSQVDARCKRLLDAQVVPFMIKLRASFVSANLSPTALGLFATVLRSLARVPMHRGPLAQQGALPLLVALATSASLDAAAKRAAAHALARIFISVNPNLVSATTIGQAVAPLLTLLSDPSADDEEATPTANGPGAGGRDLLPTFEGLLALTNLASVPPSPNDTGAEAHPSAAIARAAIPNPLDDLLLASNPMVRRAAVELLCNLAATSVTGLAAITLPLPKSANASTEAATDVAVKSASGAANGVNLVGESEKVVWGVGRRLHVLLAFADADDARTRQGASGALVAAATAPDGVGIRGIMAVERGPERVLRMLSDEDPGVVHRGLACVLGLLDDGAAKRKLEEVGLRPALKEVLERGKSLGESAKGALAEVLRALGPELK